MAPGEQFVRLSFRVPRFLQESFCAELWSEGSLGLQILSAGADIDRIDCYFAVVSDPPSTLGENWADRGVERLSREVVEDRDWLAEYRHGAAPIPLGRRFVVDPREPRSAERARSPSDFGRATRAVRGANSKLAEEMLFSISGARSPSESSGGRVVRTWDGPEDGPRGTFSGASGDRICLRVPARRAFGTGNHESTRLAVALLEELGLRGKRVLDVGSGSGILSFVCLALGAESVVAVDTDAEAVLCSRANAALNELDQLLVVAAVEAIRADPLFDVAAVNILPHHILRHMGSIAALLRGSGTLVYSGALSTQEGEVRELLSDLAFDVVGHRREGDWIALRAVKGPAR